MVYVKKIKSDETFMRSKLQHRLMDFSVHSSQTRTVSGSIAHPASVDGNRLGHGVFPQQQRKQRATQGNQFTETEPTDAKNESTW